MIRLFKAVSIPLPVAIVALALTALLLSTGIVSAAPRQQTFVDICDRTQEVQDTIVSLSSTGDTCSTVTSEELAGIGYLTVSGYSSPSVMSSDFAGLTGLLWLTIQDSPRLTEVPANAFSELKDNTTGFNIFTFTTGFSTLSLTSTAINTVHPDAFDGLTNLVELFLNDGSLETLHPGTFDDLSGLKYLTLNNNHLKTLEHDVFSGLDNLVALRIPSNNLVTLEAETFDPFKGTLSDLDLSTNSISTLPPDVFKGMSELSRINLWHNRIEVLPKGVFDGLNKLEQLTLNNNPLTKEMDAGVFDGLTSLTRLDLVSNGISSLPMGIFDGLTSLGVLDLANNSLTNLDENIFANLTNLQGLYLHGNSIASPHAELFDGLTALTHLYLHNNGLTSLHADIFDGLTSLERLYLYNNDLTTLETELFDPLDDSLTHLYLHNNGLTSLHADIFDGLTGLLILGLSGNGLTSLETELFAPLDDSLTHLYLNRNVLTSLHADIFDGLTGLKYLYLSGNKLTTLDETIFEGLTEIVYLHLNGNGLTALETELFDPLDESLSQLVLTDNSLTALPVDIFDGLTALKGLDLSCNGLTALELTRFDPFAASLTFLDITGNSFTTQPTEVDIQNKLTAVEYLYIAGTNTECLVPTDTGLSALSLSVGDLSPKFVDPPGSTVYSATVAHNVSEMTVTVTAQDPNAVIEPRTGTYVHDNDPDTVGLQIDLESAITYVGWTVRARNGIDLSYYQMIVYRDHPPATIAQLRGLTLSGVTLTETFDSRIYAYTATADITATTTTVTPELIDPDAAFVVKLNGVATDDTVLSLAEGNNTITVEVTAADGKTTQTYTVTVEVRGTVDIPPGLEVTLQLSDDLPLEGSPVTVTASVSPASPVAFTVTISATPVAPATDEDFELSANRVLRFAANATASTGTVTIRSVHDGVPEPTDVVRVSGAVSNAAIPDPDDVTVSIVNNDPEDLDIAISAPAAVDEDAGAAVVTVTLTTRKNTAPMANTELFYVGNPGETATRGADYTPPAGTGYGSSVFVATVRPSAFSPNAAGTAWVAAPSFTIGIIDDQEAERAETIVFEVDFGEARPPTHTITIRDNDATPAVSIAADNPTVVEEQPAVFTLTRTGATGSPLTVTVAVSEQADRDLLPDGAATVRTVRFRAGAATTALTVALENDRVAEPDGDLTVAVQAGAGYAPGAPSSATVTVDDGDTDTAPPTVTSVVVASTPHSGNTYRWGETIVFTVTFSEPVRVTGRPGLEVGLDNPAGVSGSTVRAGFAGLSETEQVTSDSWPAPVSRHVHFSYSVRPFDRDEDGVRLGANALRLASGDRIQSDETDTYAEFDHAALAPQRGHQVDGRETVDGEPTAPVAGAGITFVDTDGKPLELLANGTHRLSVPEGGEARYGLRLKTRPAHKVVVSHHYLTYGGDSDLTVPRNFSFDGSIRPDTWDTQTAWVKVAAAQDDDAEDGERVFDNRAFSRDPNYHDLVLPDVVVVEADDEEKGSSQGGAADPLTAEFQGLPEAHDGESAFTFRIVFSEAVAVTPEAMRTRVLTVAGGAVTGAARVDGETGVWVITVTPDTREALSISLPPASDCDTDGAVCTSDGRALSIGAAHIVNGPADQPERNTSATGTPTIGGTPQVGETLTASTSGIVDADGLTNATFNYQWLADDADIAGATGSTYTLVEADEGKAIKVRVSFTDDAGNDETLTSAATDAVAGNEEPLTSEDAAAWSATMTVEWVYQGYGYYSTDTKKAGSLSPASFEVDGTTYTVKMVETQGWWMYIGVDRELPFDFVLELDGTRFASGDASFRSYSYGNIYRWEGTGLSLRDGDTVEVRLLRALEDETAVNSAATGAPTISGTVQVGETLTADTSGIEDADGLDNAAFTYRWLADNAAIAGARGSTYTLADADEGKAITVQVSFTDDAGNDETLTSAATDAVSAAPASNTAATGAPTVSGTAQVGETLTAGTSGIVDADGLTNATFNYQWLADDADIAGATGSTYTLVEADEGQAIKVRVSFTDDAGNEEELTSGATDARHGYGRDHLHRRHRGG